MRSSNANQAGPHRKSRHRPGPSGEPILPGAIYPITAFKRTTGWGDRQSARAKDDGLKISRVGKWGYVFGQDLIDFVRREQAADSEHLQEERDVDAAAIGGMEASR